MVAAKQRVWRLWLPPFQSLHYAINVFLQVFDDRGEGVVVGGVVEEEGASEEVLGAVGEPELVGGASILATDLYDGGIDAAFGVGEVHLLFAGGLAVVEGEHARGGVDE